MLPYPATSSEVEKRIYEEALGKAESIISDLDLMDVAVDYAWPTFGRGNEAVAVASARYLVTVKRTHHGWQAVGIKFS